MRLSVIILTYNDQLNIENCLKSIKRLTDDVVIIDSFSSDKTLDICSTYGCNIYQNPFVNQAIQFNWALENAQLKYDWILRLDSDEIVPNKLIKEIQRRIGTESDVNGYALNRRMYWMNHWLKHGRIYPHYILRLFKKGYARYEERTEEHLIVQGKTSYMKNDFLEDNRNNNLDFFTHKHLATASGEVSEILNNISCDDESVEPKLFGSKVGRTRWLKLNIYNKTPLFIRPFLYFFYRYFICLGFLDGKPGFIFHVLQAFWYRFYIDAKIYEKRSDWGLTKNKYNDI